MGGIIGGIIQGRAAKKAAAVQAAASAQDLAFQRETRDMNIARLDPFYQQGLVAQNALLYELGLGDKPMIGGTVPTVETIPGQPGKKIKPAPQVGDSPAFGGILNNKTVGATKTTYRVGDKAFATMEEAQAYAKANPTGGTAYQGFQATPGYQFQFDQGTAAVNALAGARGGLNSGRTLQDLTTFGQGLANQEYGNYLARLTGVAGSGQNAATGQISAAQTAAGGVSNALSNLGNAQASGIVGAANGLASGINNQIGMWQYQKGVGGGINGNAGIFNPFFGGKGLGGFV